MSFFSFLSNLIPVVGPIIGNAIGNSNARKAQDRANDQQMKLAEYAYEKNLEMWNRQNEYNTPLNQKNRMIDAGFNPNLVYGHGSVVNTASNAPQYQAPNIGAYTDFGDLGAGQSYQLYMQDKQMRADVALKEAQKQGVLANARVSMLDAGVKVQDILAKQMDNAMKRNDVETYKKYRDLQIDLMRANRDNIDSLANYRDSVQTDLGNAQIAKYNEETKTLQFNNEIMNPLYRRQAEFSIANAIKDLAVKDQNISESKSRVALNDETLKKVSSEIVYQALKNRGQLSSNKIDAILLAYGINLRESGIYGLVQKLKKNVQVDYLPKWTYDEYYGSEK